MDQTPIDNVSTEAVQTEQKTYSTPVLTDFGSFAEITRGAINVGLDIGIYS